MLKDFDGYDIKSYIEEELDILEKKLNLALSIIFSKEDNNEEINEIIRYAYNLGIKRYRPLFATLLGEILGVKKRNSFVIGAAAEMIHTATLILTNLPFFSENISNEYCHEIYGISKTIAASTVMQNVVYQILSSETLRLSKEKKLDIISSFSKYSGIDGSLYTLLHLKAESSTRFYKANISSLFVAIAESLAISTGMNNKKDINSLKTMANNLGMLTKLYDEVKELRESNISNNENKISNIVIKAEFITNQTIMILHNFNNYDKLRVFFQNIYNDIAGYPLGEFGKEKVI